MSEPETPPVGSIVWRDLTLEEAENVRDFYASVVGWKVKAHDMGDYEDYEMRMPGTGETVAGICHARGANDDLPPQWLVYVQVEDVEASAARCLELGGRVLDGPRAMGGQLFCCIEDPEGAVLGLVGQPA
jgi:predicted enzyme related to lactoylglutathione lyase